MGVSKGNSGPPQRVAKSRNVKRERNSANENLVGAVVIFAGASTSIPRGWLLCDGSEVSQTAFPELYTLIGTTYGTAGVSGFFVLPNLQNCVVVGVLASTGICTTVGAAAGAVTHTISTAELPSHTHAVGTLASAGAWLKQVAPTTGTVDWPATVVTKDGDALTPAIAGATAATGSGTAMSIVQPSIGMHYIIRAY